MKFPFPLTDEIQEAYQAHIDYISAGQKWLLKNDPECQHEMVLIQEIITHIESVADEHFGDDDDAYHQFIKDFELENVSSGIWYEVLEAAE